MYANFGAQLPALTANVVAMSRTAREYAVLWTIMLVLLLALIPALLLSLQARVYWHKLLLRIPILKNLIIKLVTMRYCRTLGSLLTSGVDILLATDVAARSCGNLIQQRLLLEVPGDLMSGQSLYDSLLTHAAFPKPALRLVAAGEKTGQLGQSLLRAADFYEKETTISIATLTSLIEPIIITLLGIVVAFLLVALYLPLFDLVGSIT
jgi:type IV pilus assembly protein PilC